MLVKKMLVKIKLLAGLLLCVVFGATFSASAASADVAASLNGENITYDSLTKGSELEIYEAEKALYSLQMANLRKLLIEKLIKLDPRSKEMSEEQYISQYIAQPKPVTDAQIDAFIVKRRIPQDKINTNLKEQVRRYMMSQQISEQIDSWFNGQTKKHNIQINLREPEEPRFDVDIEGAPYRGGENAKVTIIEFSDFECPYCSRANDTLYQLSKMYGDKIKIVYKHFPLSSIHPGAEKAAEASICAQEQGMGNFWKLHDKMFENYRNLSVGIIKDMAKEIGLNTESFNQCLSTGKYAARVAAEVQQAQRLGIQSTPAFYVNGRFIKGAQPIDIFQQMIDEEINQ
ncbi:DsbA family protein [Aliikangiella coralliicola]|uniref:DsbA family protein n=1 Tax=Aliikangiella coralliicola TaxID=2592383 RepID=A0A545U6E3_9GAMM|nr:thioredoxin domain-containing protein [Aliikangiella coralliicola]TQV85036.1 DsbA family protein [Aliikangiella coralliicola]